MADGHMVLELTHSQQLALVDLLLEHILRCPGGTTEVFIDVVAGVETTPIDLLNAVLQHSRWALEQGGDRCRK